MVRNRIKALRAEAGISATALSERMRGGVDKAAMSFIEGGRVLPTRDGLDAMCEFFDCSPTDLYEKRELDLLAVRAKAETAEQTPPVKTVVLRATEDKPQETSGFEKLEGADRHEGMEQIRVWLPVDEKAALFKAVSALGYHSVAEWLREMYRATLHKYISLKLQDTAKLHEAIPPTTKNQTAGS